MDVAFSGDADGGRAECVDRARRRASTTRRSRRTAASTSSTTPPKPTRFEKSGEMGRGVTRPGVGPNGETVVGDSERALQLFFFKHGISEAVPEPPPPIQRDRVARRQDAHHDGPRVPRDLEPHPGALHARIPGRHLADAARHRGPGDSKGLVPHPPREVQARRLVLDSAGRRARRRASLPKLSYELQLNWPALANVGAQPANVGALLEDANIAWDPQGRGKFRVVFGQFKVPFGRQQMTSSGNQQFVDRSLVVRRVRARPRHRRRGPGRDLEQQARVPRGRLQRQRADAPDQRQRNVPGTTPA